MLTPELASSYRALAEVIGNVKPPTATAEDISKSALQVISGSQVAEWVDAGRVIASSADRCAICLDDYEADQDCRVMSCSASKATFVPCFDFWVDSMSSPFYRAHLREFVRVGFTRAKLTHRATCLAPAPTLH